MPNSPLVTCLCVTKGRRDTWLPKAVECFKQQTYARRELLIVGDTAADMGLDSSQLDSNIYRLWSESWLSLGAKRNYVCSIMNPSVIVAVWDDDDHSAPGRLAQQVAELESTGKAVTGYDCMKFTDGKDWWQFQCAAGFVLGTSLCFRRSWWESHTFPDLQKGEDQVFANVAHEAGQLAVCPDLNLMYATIHDGNTSKRDTNWHGWTKLQDEAQAKSISAQQ